MLLGLIFHLVNKDIEESIQHKNRKIQKLTEEAEAYYTKAAENLNEKIKNLDEYKKNTQMTTIRHYCEVFRTIKNITYQKFEESNFRDADYNSFEIVKLVSGYDGKSGKLGDYLVGNIAEGVLGGAVLVATSGLILPTLGLSGAVGGLIRGCRLTDQEKEVDAVLAQQKLICEEAKIRADILNDVAEKCDELIGIMRVLDNLVSRSIISIKGCIKQYGSNYDNWTESEQYMLMTSVNMVAGLNKIITTPIVMQNGSINSQFIKIVEQARVLPEGKPMEQNSPEETKDIYMCVGCIDSAMFQSNVLFFKSEFGSQKAKIAAGIIPEQISNSWQCPFCGSDKYKIKKYSVMPLSSKEIHNRIVCIRTEDDYFSWIAGMMSLPEEEIKSVNRSETAKNVRNEIKKIETIYDYDTIKEAAKNYSVMVKKCNWSDKTDREWAHTVYVKPLRNIRENYLRMLKSYLPNG